MRVVINPQMQIGEVDISKIEFDPKSRDEMPQVLMGLQYIYTNIQIREEIFSLLEKNISPTVDKANGRPGMELWKILVLGVVRLNLNWDYDRLHNEANYHLQIRQMLGHGIFDFDKSYNLQTIKDNVSLLTEELLDQINQVVVRAGHQLVKKKEGDVLTARSDSFVFETNVHYPTDINLLYDAMRRVIILIARLSKQNGISAWRQYKHIIKRIKNLLYIVQNKKRSKSKNEEQKEKQNLLIIEAHHNYINFVTKELNKAIQTLETLQKEGDIGINLHSIESIQIYIDHAKRQIDQIHRRVFNGEIIPHNEKVFSIFEPHTDWISKGKAGVPVEFGLRVNIIEDQHQFILHHIVMEKITDDQVAVRMVEETKFRFPDLRVVSFDKGYYSPENQKILSETLDLLILPKKGKLSKEDQQREGSQDFKSLRRNHSGVESAINALEVHGLDFCPDRGIDNFKKYVALAVVARNIQLIGAILKKNEKKREERRNKKHLTQKLAA